MLGGASVPVLEADDVLDLWRRDLENRRVVESVTRCTVPGVIRRAAPGPTTSEAVSFWPGSAISISARPEWMSHDSSFSR